jgi:hypothetical protein
MEAVASKDGSARKYTSVDGFQSSLFFYCFPLGAAKSVYQLPHRRVKADGDEPSRIGLCSRTAGRVSVKDHILITLC